MLAERKHKMKWSPNPCGNFWAKDTSKFGQKMLEKFGWTPGKGLGVNEQGITNPVKLKCNSTQKGLGYERGSKSDFFQHQKEFDSMLAELRSSDSQSTESESIVSLEQASKNCRTRVHYHKFTRGKDLSRYSEKDLSCIFGALPALSSRNSSTQTGTKLVDKNTSGEKEDVSKEINLKKSSKQKRKRKSANNADSNIENELISYENINEEDICHEVSNEDPLDDVSYESKREKRKKKKRMLQNLNEDEAKNGDDPLPNNESSFNSEPAVKSKKKKKNLKE